MSKCIQEDILRSYLDSELSGAETEAAANHLKSCPACADKMEILRSEASAVETLLGSLAPEQTLPTAAPALLPIPQQRFAARFGWTAVLSLGALATVIVAALLLLMRHASPQAPSIGARQPVQSAPSVAATDHPKQAKDAGLPQQVKRQPVSMRAPNHRPSLEHFMRLDNDGPIESGLVYRVKLPGSLFTSLDPAVISSEISAEVIVDGSGRPRAIRFLK